MFYKLNKNCLNDFYLTANDCRNQKGSFLKMAKIANLSGYNFFENDLTITIFLFV